MAKIIATRGVQWPLVAEQTINYSDWFVDTLLGTKKTCGSTVALSSNPNEPSLTSGKNSTCSIPLFNMPRGAVVIGGAVVIETAFVGSTATLSVGKAGATTVFVSALDVAATTNAAFTVTTTVPLTSNDGTNLVGTLTLGNGDFTAGKVRVFVYYYIEGKANEVVPS